MDEPPEEEQAERDEEEEELEDDADARERLEAEITEQHEAAQEAASAVGDLCRDELRIATVELLADPPVHRVQRMLAKGVLPFTEQRAGLLESCFALDTDAARTLVAQGHAVESPFGYWDPVALHRREALQPVQHKPRALL